MTCAHDENRGRQIAVGVAILVVLTLVVCGALTGWRYLPGVFGEWIGMMIGLLTTPFILEASFVAIGLVLVMTLNHWQMKRDGDEMVYLEHLEGPDVPQGMPEEAKWVVYRQPPLEGEVPTLRAQVEGALAIQDYESAAETIAAMSDEELKLPETLELRIQLARATGLDELAGQLEAELRGLCGTGL